MNLVNIIETKKLDCPIFEGTWVEFYTDVPMYVAVKMSDTDKENAILLMTAVIKDWNFADNNGNKLELNENGIGMLPSKVANWIVNNATEIIQPDKDKKKLSEQN